MNEIKSEVKVIKVGYTITVDVDSWWENYYEKPDPADIREIMREEIEEALRRRGVTAEVR